MGFIGFSITVDGDERRQSKVRLGVSHWFSDVILLLILFDRCHYFLLLQDIKLCRFSKTIDGCLLCEPHWRIIHDLFIYFGLLCLLCLLCLLLILRWVIFTLGIPTCIELIHWIHSIVNYDDPVLEPTVLVVSERCLELEISCSCRQILYWFRAKIATRLRRASHTRGSRPRQFPAPSMVVHSEPIGNWRERGRCKEANISTRLRRKFLFSCLV